MALAPVPPTFNVGAATVFAFVNLTQILAPFSSVKVELPSAIVATFATVAAAVEQVAYLGEPTI